MLTNSFPLGNVLAMKFPSPIVNLSGHKHLKTNSFWKGIDSSHFHSRGSFSISGVKSLYQSLNLPGLSLRSLANVSNSGISISFYIDCQAKSGNQSGKGLISSLVGQ
jgi:hypothetical protein